MSVPALALVAAAYRFPGGASVGPCTLSVAPGETVLVTGPTGCGKSTLLRLCAGLIQRHGRGAWSGEVCVYGQDPGRLVAADRVRTLGFVAQEPDDQVIAGTVTGEVRFGLENAGYPEAEIVARAARAIDAVGLAGLEKRAPMSLSGGQRQRLIIGAALAAGARLLLLDEPLAQLDPEGADRVIGLLREVARTGVAVVLVEHRLETVLPYVDRTVLMEGGRVLVDPLLGVAPLRRLGLAGPAEAELTARLGPGPWRPAVVAPAVVAERGPGPAPGASVIRLACVTAGWSPRTPVLQAVDLAFQAGERVAVLGANGAGKSTLLAVIAGLLRPTGGSILVSGRVIAVPQNPDLVLFSATVAEELAYGPEAWGAADVAARVGEAAEALSVDGLLTRPPQSLSRGQRLRVAVASAVSCAPPVLLLDEPTSGQDREQVERMLCGVARALPETLLIFATHDVDVALRHATRIIVLDAGRVVVDLTSPRPGSDDPSLLAALAPAVAGLPVTLPPLARLCLRSGVPYGTLDEVAARLVGDGEPS